MASTRPSRPRPAAAAPTASQAFAAALDKRLARVRRWLADIHDPELGPVGQSLSGAFCRAASAEQADGDLKVNAVFRSFAWPPAPGRRGFRNNIAYGPSVLHDDARLFGARAHEHIHALQYRRAAVLYADPFNDASPFVLSPLSYVQRKERLEQDAYAKGAWLQSLLPDRLHRALDNTPLSVGAFKRLRRRHGSLEKTMAAAARYASGRKGYWLHGTTKHPARDLWHEVALREYASIMEARAKKDLPPPRFVTMSFEGIAAIGDSAGVNPFRADPALCQSPVQLSAENKKLLREIEDRWQVPPQDSLPTLADALGQAGMTPAGLICRSRRHRGPAA